jgi:hypothetical protein
MKHEGTCVVRGLFRGDARQLVAGPSRAGSFPAVRRNASRPSRYCRRSAPSRYFSGPAFLPPRSNHRVCTLPLHCCLDGTPVGNCGRSGIAH